MRLEVYNVSGQLVRVLVDGSQGRGVYRVRWDGKDQNGTRISSGVYLYRLTANGFTATRRMLLLK